MYDIYLSSPDKLLRILSQDSHTMFDSHPNTAERYLVCRRSYRQLVGLSWWGLHVNHLACQVYLYEYVQPVTERLFAEQLKYEHHQYHLDTLAGMTAGTLPVSKASTGRSSRNTWLRSQYQLCDCSAPRDYKLLSFSGLDDLKCNVDRKFGRLY